MALKRFHGSFTNGFAMKEYTVLLPPPCTNNDLHMGHLAGVYIPGDVYARFMKQQGHQVFVVCGADQNNTYTEIKSQKLNESFTKTQSRYADAIAESLQAAGIHLDSFVRTTDPQHQVGIQAITKKLIHSQKAKIISYPQPYCNHCKIFLSDAEIEGICHVCNSSCDGGICETCNSPIFNRNLKQAKHRACNNQVIFRQTRLLGLDLSELKSIFLKSIDSTRWSTRLKRQVSNYLKNSDYDMIPLTNHYPKGNAAGVTGLDAKYLAIWHEAIWGGITGECIQLKQKMDDFLQNLQEQPKTWISFMGQDTEFYYAVSLSTILLSFGIKPCSHDVVVHRFVKFEGEKFSSSRQHVLYLHDLVKEYNLDIIRLYCLSILNTYEDDANNFVLDDLKQLNDYIQRFLNKLKKDIAKLSPTSVSKLTANPMLQTLYADYVEAMQTYNFQLVYQCIIKLMQSMEQQELLAETIHLWLKMITPVMPHLAADYSARLPQRSLCI